MRKPELLYGHSVLEILQMLDWWSRHATGDEIEHLWAILSALRGPDDSDTVLKGQTTAWVRTAALPGLAALAGATIAKPWGKAAEAVTDEKLEELVLDAEKLESANPEHSVHFVRHIQRAFEALIREKRFQAPRDQHAIDAGEMEGV